MRCETDCPRLPTIPCLHLPSLDSTFLTLHGAFYPGGNRQKGKAVHLCGQNSRVHGGAFSGGACGEGCRLELLWELRSDHQVAQLEWFAVRSAGQLNLGLDHGPQLMRLLRHDGIEGSEGPIQCVVCSPTPSHVPWPKGHRRIEIRSAGALPYLISSVDKRQGRAWVGGGTGNNYTGRKDTMAHRGLPGLRAHWGPGEQLVAEPQRIARSLLLIYRRGAPGCPEGFRIPRHPSRCWKIAWHLYRTHPHPLERLSQL